jgi:hypothetical protein
MILTTQLQVFFAGLAGGVVLELVHWYAIRRDLDFPIYAKSAKYWIISALMAVAGGGLAVLYFGTKAEAIVALHVGLSAPLILQKLATTLAQTPGGKGGAPNVMSFFRW